MSMPKMVRVEIPVELVQRIQRHWRIARDVVGYDIVPTYCRTEISDQVPTGSALQFRFRSIDQAKEAGIALADLMEHQRYRITTPF